MRNANEKEVRSLDRHDLIELEMTTEVRTMIDLADIDGIEIECQECTAKIAYPIEKTHEKFSPKCPNCNADLFMIRGSGIDADSEVRNHLLSLVRTVKYFAKPTSDLHANVRLHISGKGVR